MLTIKSRFLNFRDRQGKEYTFAELDALYNALIKPDVVNFNDQLSKGFPEAITEKIANKISVDINSTVLILNDISLMMTKRLLDLGFDYKNIYLAYGKWDKKTAVPSENLATYKIMKRYISANIIEPLNVITLEEMFKLGNQKIDLIIANPPYGKIGANITKKIIDSIDFKEYINLLPANDYKRNNTKDLFNYQSGMEAINNGFDDAAVTTHLAVIQKSKANNMTLDEFERSQYIDKSLDKYFLENSKRSHYAIDAAVATMPKNLDFNTTNSIFINHRDGANRHLAYTKNCAAYFINVLNKTYRETFEQFGMKKDKYGRLFDAALINFKTLSEKQFCANFIYSQTGFKFISKLFNSINTDSWVALAIWMPKVDWTRSWTVEEILADYGYTEEEIQEVMDDLKNFKGMED